MDAFNTINALNCAVDLLMKTGKPADMRNAKRLQMLSNTICDAMETAQLEYITSGETISIDFDL